VAGASAEDVPNAGINTIDLPQVFQGTSPLNVDGDKNDFVGFTNAVNPYTGPLAPSAGNALGDSNAVNVVPGADFIGTVLDGGQPSGNPIDDRSAPAQDFSYSDQLLNGAIVDVDVNGDGAAEFTGGADASQRADFGIVTTDAGSAAADTGATFTFSFALNEDAEVRFDATISANLEAWVSDDAAEISSAQASASFVFDILDSNGISVFDDPGTIEEEAGIEFLRDIGRTQGDPGRTTRDFLADVDSDVVTLLAGDVYTLSLRSTANVDGRNTVDVPSPAPLLLFGAGLVGLRTMSRRKQRKANCA
jgi:hypothetical protein